MKRKKNNNLICLNIGKRKLYYTSSNRAGQYLGLKGASISWAITHCNILKTNEGEDVTITIVDGSDIPYKYINN